MWNNISLSSFLDRVTLLDRPLGRAREFFQRNGSSEDEAHFRAESSDDNDVITCGASSCDFDVLETEEEVDWDSDWANPGEDTLQMVATLYTKLWDRKSQTVDVTRAETTLASCPPRENVLLIEDEDHYNLMHKAVIFNSLPMMQILLSHGCDANWVNRKSCIHSPSCPHANVGVLHLACYLGRKDVVEMLLRWGVDKSAKRRICSTAALQSPSHLHPDNLVACWTSEKEEILNSCGAREPIFFAVLGDQVEVVKLFIKEDSSRPYIEELHLLHLACRIGAGDCLTYFVSVSATILNSCDTDGMPPLLLAMKHGLRHVSHILDSGCDVTMFNDLWERGANIYHFLFSALPIGDEDHVTLCDILKHISKHKMVDINSRRESSGSSPLHELLHAVNRVPRGNGKVCDIRSTYLTSYDNSIVDGIRFLVQNGADVQAQDLAGDSILSTILANKNQLARCALVLNQQVPEHSRLSLMSGNFGLDNVINIVHLLLDNITENELEGDIEDGQSLISVLLKTICCFDNDMEENMWTSPFEILQQGDILAKYSELLAALLKYCDPNKHDGELTPLFYLLSQATLSPDADDYMYVISTDHARILAALADILLENGARTECEHTDDGGEAVRYSSMDVLVYFLRKMQAYPHSRTIDDLLALRHLLTAVLKYGAQPFLHNTKFYHGPDFVNTEAAAGSARASLHPTYTFLYQFLCFGAMNLQYVNEGGTYYDLLALITNSTPQNIVYMAFQSARLVFTCMHWPDTCECGLCLGFHDMLDGYLAAPRSLKQLCRLSVRGSIGRLSPQTVGELSLPTSLELFILLQDQ